MVRSERSTPPQFSVSGLLYCSDFRFPFSTFQGNPREKIVMPLLFCFSKEIVDLKRTNLTLQKFEDMNSLKI